MSCHSHDTSSGDGGASDECEISANSAKMQELSLKCRKFKQTESVRKRKSFKSERLWMTRRAENKKRSFLADIGKK